VRNSVLPTVPYKSTINYTVLKFKYYLPHIAYTQDTFNTIINTVFHLFLLVTKFIFSNFFYFFPQKFPYVRLQNFYTGV
jgi:hypothetical protein